MVSRMKVVLMVWTLALGCETTEKGFLSSMKRFRNPEHFFLEFKK